MGVTFIVAAAGSGKRMNLGYPKQFLKWREKEIFIHTLEKLENLKEIDRIVVVTQRENIDLIKRLARENKISKVEHVVEGGSERQDSIYKGLKVVSDDIIGVQDGVRPFVPVKGVRKALKVLKEEEEVDGTLIGVVSKDTIKIIDEDGYIVETPNRSRCILAQTPQIFNGDILKRAYEKAKEDGFLGTDDASLVERIGGRVKVVEGSYENIKITTVEDLKYLD